MGTTTKLAPNDKKIIGLLRYGLDLIRANVNDYKIYLNDDQNAIFLLSSAEIVIVYEKNELFEYLQGNRSAMLDVLQKYWKQEKPLIDIRKEAISPDGDKDDYENPETNPFYDEAWKMIGEENGLEQEELVEEDYREE